ncbi:hypothetical protein [Idiomarina xiamenensis]|uniref:Uncharacterized protein n=1 Tax=Idiomarina xiamenensis 10-D-4 TaxID=740709 RepID=K2KMN9_9GAMM|nr:hypothetical protein [Idiomarina xiamenensis]EKE83704.1 hypothetical protein A10D4_07645 [Idiomarina xiamenensis 10-D-4]
MDFFDPKIILTAVSIIFISVPTVIYQYLSHYSRLNRNRLSLLSRAAQNTELSEQWRLHFRDQVLDEAFFQAHRVRANNGKKHYLLTLYSYVQQRCSFRQLILTFDRIKFINGRYRFNIDIFAALWFSYSLIVTIANFAMALLLIVLLIGTLQSQQDLPWQWGFLTIPLFAVLALYSLRESMKFILACHIRRILKQLPADARAELGV